MASYVRFPGIAGNSVDARHVHWIDIESMSWSDSQSMPPGSAGSGRQGLASPTSVVTFFKHADMATAKLWNASNRGTVFADVVAEFTGEREGSAYTQRYLFDDVVIVSINVSSPLGSGRASESVTINFSRVARQQF